MKLLKIIYNLLIVCLLLIALLLVIPILPIPGNFKVFSVLSGSMEPRIHVGGVVVIKPMTSYGVGQIVSFSQNPKTQISTTHRIVKINSQDNKITYSTKGDANNIPDTNEVTENEILGKVIFSVPYLGYALDFVRKPPGFILVIVVPAVVIIYDEILKIKKEILKMKKKRALKIKNQNAETATFDTVPIKDTDHADKD